jgi:hypothetical protein
VQVYSEVVEHLFTECRDKPVTDFTSWRALTTYITLSAGKEILSPQSALKQRMMRFQKWMLGHLSDVPEFVVLAVVQASLCDRNAFFRKRMLVTLSQFAGKFLDNLDDVNTVGARSNVVSLYTFTAHRYLARLLLLLHFHSMLSIDLYVLIPSVSAWSTCHTVLRTCHR